MARSSCSLGSCGNSRPACVLTMPLNVSTRFCRSAASRSRSLLIALGLLGGFDGVLEVLAVDVEHGLAEHLEQAAVGVPGEPLVAGLLGQALHRLVGQADVQDGIHHARHGELRPGPDADEQRVGRIAELAAYRRFQLIQVVRDFLVEACWRRTLFQVVTTCLGGNDESGRHRQADIGHLGQVGTLTAQQILKILVTFCKVINELRHFPAPRSAQRHVSTRDSTGEGTSRRRDQSHVLPASGYPPGDRDGPSSHRSEALPARTAAVAPDAGIAPNTGTW